MSHESPLERSGMENKKGKIYFEDVTEKCSAVVS